MLESAYRYALQNQAFFWDAAATHVRLSGTALGIACGLCLPLGLYVARRRLFSSQILHLINGLRVVPSLAILFLAVPYLGLGFLPALVALTVLACPPILANTEAGFRSVDRAVVEAARGMGMDAGQVLWRVEIPLALPVVVAGVRTAAVEVTASATLAAFIGGGGLGDFIYRGFALFDPSVMLVGAIPIAALTMLAEGTLAATQRWLQTVTAAA
jgi:osmoprotectant transport system permease protein